MPDFLAAFEWSAKAVRDLCRSVPNPLTYTGPFVNCAGCGSKYAPGLLQPCYACRLSEREAEEEVLEPRSNESQTDFGPCECVCEVCAAGDHCDTASCATLPDEPYFGEFAFGYNTYLPLPETPAASATGSAVEGAPHLTCPPTSGGADLTWAEYVQPAITDLLAEHVFRFANHSSVGSNAHCLCGDRPRDQLEWREHVAELLSELLEDVLLGEEAAL